MQLAGPGVMGPPADHDGALAVLREAASLGITHVDTSDAYGPHVTSQVIREALQPYPESLRIVSKAGATRDSRGGWPPAREPEELRRAVNENLENLGLEVLDVPFFPLGGFSPLQSLVLSAVAGRLDTTPMSVALAWLLQRSPNILLIPGTSSAAHLRENVAGAGLSLSGKDLAELDAIGR
jgi:aryl-alcohol dehydrogenase-like predicted oxidoreductase